MFIILGGFLLFKSSKWVGKPEKLGIMIFEKDTKQKKKTI